MAEDDAAAVMAAPLRNQGEVGRAALCGIVCGLQIDSCLTIAHSTTLPATTLPTTWPIDADFYPIEAINRSK